jgi:hypothetical protein
VTETEPDPLLERVSAWVGKPMSTDKRMNVKPVRTLGLRFD